METKVLFPGALHIDIYKGQGFIYQVDELDKAKKLLHLLPVPEEEADKRANIMQQMGFGNTYNLVGGIMEWEGPVVAPEQE